jgi:hypothetical protein
MKFTLALQDMYMDDDVDLMVRTIARQGNMTEEEVWEFVNSFVGNAEFVTLQFDTTDKSCRVLKTDEEGVNEWTAERDVILKLEHQNFDEQVHELQRQLDEALATLGKEDQKDTPYARSMLRFIMDTRETLKQMQGEWEEEEDNGTIYGIDEDEVEFDDEDEIEDADY